MNIDLFFGLLKEKYGTNFDLKKQISVMECTSAEEVLLELFYDKKWWDETFRLAHTISIPYSEYRRLYGGRKG